jgi:hypothetical protein
MAEFQWSFSLDIEIGPRRATCPPLATAGTLAPGGLPFACSMDSKVPCYQIDRWDEFFENNKSRERDACRWVAMPNRHDSMGFLKVMNEPDGATVYGIWCLIVQLCSRQKRPRNGYMTDTGLPAGCPWSAQDLALRWHRTGTEVDRALQVLESVGWIRTYGEVPAKCPPSARQVPLNGMEWNGMEEKRKELEPPKSPKGDIGEDQHRIDSGTIDAIYQQYPRHVGKAAALKAIRVALRGIASRLGAPSDPAAWLTERVKRYADARAGQDPQFTPHPATWFNQGRFDDDPAEWVRRGCEANGGQRQVPPGSGSVAQPSGNPGSYPSPRHRDEKSRREYPEPTRVIPTFG